MTRVWNEKEISHILNSGSVLRHCQKEVTECDAGFGVVDKGERWVTTAS